MVGDKTNILTPNDVYTGKGLIWHHETFNNHIKHYCKKMVKQMREVTSSIGLHPIKRNY